MSAAVSPGRDLIQIQRDIFPDKGIVPNNPYRSPNSAANKTPNRRITQRNPPLARVLPFALDGEEENLASHTGLGHCEVGVAVVVCGEFQGLRPSARSVLSESAAQRFVFCSGFSSTNSLQSPLT